MGITFLSKLRKYDHATAKLSFCIEEQRNLKIVVSQFTCPTNSESNHRLWRQKTRSHSERRQAGPTPCLILIQLQHCGFHFRAELKTAYNKVKTTYKNSSTEKATDERTRLQTNYNKVVVKARRNGLIRFRSSIANQSEVYRLVEVLGLVTEVENRMEDKVTDKIFGHRGGI